MAERHLVLVGLMGAGKTTVGQRCAELLDRPFVDTDELVVATAGMPVAEIFEHSRVSRASAAASATRSPTRARRPSRS